MNVLGPVGKRADDLSLDFIETLAKEANGDDEALLAMLGEASEASDRHQERLRLARLEAARRLRDRGVPMTEIADAAGLTDSYLSRQLIGTGSARRVDRTKRRQRRVRRNYPPPT